MSDNTIYDACSECGERHTPNGTPVPGLWGMHAEIDCRVPDRPGFVFVPVSENNIRTQLRDQYEGQLQREIRWGTDEK